MKWLSETIGNIILWPTFKQYPLYNASSIQTIEGLSNCYYWQKHADGSRPIYKLDPIGILKLSEEYTESEIITEDLLRRFIETTNSNKNFIRTKNSLYYVNADYRTTICKKINISTSDLQQFDRALKPGSARLLSTSEVVSIRENYCQEIQLSLRSYIVGDLNDLNYTDGQTYLTNVNTELLSKIRDIDKNKYSIKYTNVITADGIDLPTLSINSKHSSNKKYVICFSPMGFRFWYIRDMLSLVDAGFNVRTFCYRNHNQHLATSKHDVIQDGISQIQTLLLDETIANEDIFLFGTSLGGAIAIEVASKFPGVRVLADRTFSSIQAVINSYTFNYINKFINIFSKSFYEDTSPLLIIVKLIFLPLTTLIIALGYLIASLLVNITNWNINPAQALQVIPKENREYFVAKTPSSINGVHIDDQVIPYEASLYKCQYLQSERRSEKKFNNTNGQLSTANKYRKFFYKDPQKHYSYCSHGAYLSELSNIEGKNADDLRLNFLTMVK